MNITLVQNTNKFNYFRPSAYKKMEHVYTPVKQPEQKQQFISASTYKANFLPSFGKLKKIGTVPIIDRDTGKVVNAILRREDIGNFVRFQLLVKKEEVGYMNMDCDSIFPEGDVVLTEPDNNIPKICHLRTIKGDKYAGIGSALLDQAVKESEKRGKLGALWLSADTGYAHSLSSYRANESPIPFYYKLGFESLDKSLDAKIKEALQTSKYGILPSSAILVLQSSKSEDLKHYYSNHYTYDLR